MIEGREFQVWEYRTSHGSLLIRSPALAEFHTNIDIIFKGTTHIIGPTRLGRIDTIAESAEGIPIEISLDDQIYSIWKIASEAGNLFIIAAFMNVEENEKALFESIFTIYFSKHNCISDRKMDILAPSPLLYMRKATETALAIRCFQRRHRFPLQRKTVTPQAAP